MLIWDWIKHVDQYCHLFWTIPTYHNVNYCMINKLSAWKLWKVVKNSILSDVHSHDKEKIHKNYINIIQILSFLRNWEYNWETSIKWAYLCNRRSLRLYISGRKLTLDFSIQADHKGVRLGILMIWRSQFVEWICEFPRRLLDICQL